MNRFSQNGVHHFEGVWPVLVTPFDDNLQIDVPIYHEMIEWHLQHGCHGIYALCLSSEMYQLEETEQFLLIKEAVKVVNGRVPIAITGNIKPSLDHTIAFSEKACDLGADVVMMTVPSHITEESDILEYFLTLAEKTNIPLGIYECPFPRHQILDIASIKTLAETNRFYAYKETSCRLDKIKAILEFSGNTSLSLLQANIPFLIEAQLAGANGSMNVASNWIPDLVVDVYNYLQKGQEQDARKLHQIVCTMELAQRSVHPWGVKYLMSKRGLSIKPHTRLPKKLTEEEKKSLDLCFSWWFDDDKRLRPELISMAEATL